MCAHKKLKKVIHSIELEDQTTFNLYKVTVTSCDDPHTLKIASAVHATLRQMGLDPDFKEIRYVEK